MPAALEMLNAMARPGVMLFIHHGSLTDKWTLKLECETGGDAVKLQSGPNKNFLVALTTLYDKWYALSGTDTLFKSALLAPPLVESELQPLPITDSPPEP